MLAFEENRPASLNCPFQHIFSPLCLTMYYYSLWKLSCWQSRQKIRCRSLDKWLVQLRVNIANYWDTKAVWLPTDQFRIRPQIHRYSPIPCSLKVIKINDTPSNVLIGYNVLTASIYALWGKRILKSGWICTYFENWEFFKTYFDV